MRSRLLAAFAGAAATIAVTVGVMTAAGVGFASGGGTINGCVKAPAGRLRVVNSSTVCRPGETAIQWNQQGPPGPSVTFVRRTQTGTVLAGQWSAVTSFCLAGEVVTGGGYSVGSIGFNDKVNQDEPLTQGGLDGWIMALNNSTAFNLPVWVTAICAQHP